MFAEYSARCKGFKSFAKNLPQRSRYCLRFLSIVKFVTKDHVRRVFSTLQRFQVICKKSSAKIKILFEIFINRQVCYQRSCSQSIQHVAKVSSHLQKIFRKDQDIV